MVADPGYASESFSFVARKGPTTLIKAGVKNDEQTFASVRCGFVSPSCNQFSSEA